MFHLESNVDDVRKKLSDLQNRVGAVDGEHQVNFHELFTTAFMSEHTEFQSIGEMFEKSGFIINTQEDFSQLPKHELDQAVAAHTEFISWREMLRKRVLRCS